MTLNSFSLVLFEVYLFYSVSTIKDIHALVLCSLRIPTFLGVLRVLLISFKFLHHISFILADAASKISCVMHLNLK